MRSHIFSFSQQALINLKIGLNEALILDYIINFLNNTKSKTQTINQKLYIWISIPKLLEDLPILNIKERMLRTVLENLEQKNIIKRKFIDKKLFIYVNTHLLANSQTFTQPELCLTTTDKALIKTLCGNKLQKNAQNDNLPAKNCTHCGKKLPLIINYYKNKIKIITCNCNVASINENQFLELLKNMLKQKLTPLAYELTTKNMTVLTLAPNLIILNAGVTEILQKNTHGNFEQTLTTVLETLLRS